MADSSLAALAQRFRRFADHECAVAGSPLYGVLARTVADDGDLLALAAHARPGQPPANMLLAAVRLLLRDEPCDRLAAFYPDLTAQPAPLEGAGDAFRVFCLGHGAAIRWILETRSVNTNEIARASVLLPAFGLAAERFGAAPLHLLEIGPSAGLLLLWDRLGYRYTTAEGAERTHGAEDAPWTLSCAVRGGWPPLPKHLPTVASRLGIDVTPLDPTDAADAAWLRALVWPEQPDRLERLDRALALARRAPPPLVAGDALDVLPGRLDDLPSDGVACVYHAFAINQFSEAARQTLQEILHTAARKRPVVRIGLEWYDPGGAELHWSVYGDGARAEDVTLARCDPHGAWIAWQAGPNPAS